MPSLDGHASPVETHRSGLGYAIIAWHMASLASSLHAVLGVADPIGHQEACKADRPRDIWELEAMTNPFDDDDGRYTVLANAEGQHCLWPSFASAPDGWTVVHEDDTRDRCLAYVEEHWTDMRPASLVAVVENR
jgi:MbtH protein